MYKPIIQGYRVPVVSTIKNNDISGFWSHFCLILDHFGPQMSPNFSGKYGLSRLCHVYKPNIHGFCGLIY